MALTSPPPDAPGRPDPETARLVRDSCSELRDRRAELAARFGAELAALDAPLLPERVVEVLDAVLAGITGADEDLTESRWRQLGGLPELVRLAGLGGDGLGVIGHALVRAVREALADEWSSALSSGWMAYHVWLTAQLTAGAASFGPAAVTPGTAEPAGTPLGPPPRVVPRVVASSPQLAPRPEPG